MGKNLSEERKKFIVEAKLRGERDVDVANRDQNPSHEMAQPKPRPQPNRAFLGDLGAPSRRKKIQQQDLAVPRPTRRMEPHPRGHFQRSCGVNASKNEGCHQVEGLPD
uniref:Uncharacterized protein n=1 Tax=Acrobeloides nanus TaxID=290746 RepID=A0A914DR35_9BILA